MPGNFDGEFEHVAQCCKVCYETPRKRFLQTTQFLIHNHVVVIPHPPYSPDIAPCDYENRRWMLTAFEKIISGVLSKSVKRFGIYVHVHKVNVTLLKRMTVKIR